MTGNEKQQEKGHCRGKQHGGKSKTVSDKLKNESCW